MKSNETIFGLSKEEIERQCKIKKPEGDLAQTPIAKGEYLEPCLRGAKKILEDPETLKKVKDFLTNSNYDLGTIKSKEDLTEEEIKLEYGIQDNEIILRIYEIKLAIKDKKQKNMSIDELMSFLKSIMNYDDMQIWLMRKQIQGIDVTLNDKLKKLFELKSNEDILRSYGVEQNYNQNNINGPRKILEKNQDC